MRFTSLFIVAALIPSALFAQNNPTATTPSAENHENSRSPLDFFVGFRPFDLRGFSSTLDSVDFKTSSRTWDLDLGATAALPNPIPEANSNTTTKSYPDVNKTYKESGHLFSSFPWDVNTLLRRLTFSARYRDAVARFAFAPWLPDMQSFSSPMSVFQDFASHGPGDDFPAPEPSPASGASPANLTRLGWFSPWGELGVGFAWSTSANTMEKDRRWAYSYATGLYGQRSFQILGVELSALAGLYYVTGNAASLNETRTSNLPDIPTKVVVNGTTQPEPTPDPDPVEVTTRSRIDARERMSGFALEGSLEARYSLTPRAEAWSALRLSHTSVSVRESQQNSLERRKNTKAYSKVTHRSQSNADLDYDLSVNAWIWEIAGIGFYL